MNGTSAKNVHPKSSISPGWQKLLTTAAVIYAFSVYGVTQVIPGPSLEEIATLTNSSLTAVSHGIAIRSAGYAAGCLSLGHLFHHVDRQIGFILCIAACAVTTMYVPFSGSLLVHNTLMIIFGFGSGGIDVASNAWIMQLWGKRSGQKLQIMHFGYAVGRTAGFLLISRFLSKASVAMKMERVMEGDVIRNPSSIEAPFIISGLALLLAAAFLTCVRYLDHKENEYADMDVQPRVAASSSLENDSPSYRRFIIVAFCILMLFYPGCEFNSFTFLSQFFVYGDLQASKSSAASMQSFMSFGFAIARAACIFIAAFVPSKSVITFSIACLATSYVMLLFYADMSLAWIHIALALDGIGLGPMTPSTYTFMRERIVVDDRICGILLFCRSLSQIIVSILMGFLIEFHHMSFVYWSLACLTVTGISFVSLIINDVLAAKQRNAGH